MTEPLPLNQLVYLSPEAYHADCAAVPSLSSSIACELITRSPRHAWLKHPRFGGVPSESTASTDRGELMHRLLLDAGASLAVLDFDNFRTKEAQTKRDEATARGRIPVLKRVLDGAMDDLVQLRKQLKSFGIELNGVSEQVAVWTDTTSGGAEVICRSMLDHWDEPAATLYDLKTCRSAHPKAVQSHVVSYGYDIQYAAYTRALAKCYPALAGRLDYVLLFVELEPAVTVQPYRLSGAMRTLGESRWQRAVDLWSECLASGQWPAYSASVLSVEPPPWALYDDIPVAEALP